jgi:protein-disulfide isomerase
MSNRQARREQMRAARQQRQQRPQRGGRSSGPSRSPGPRRGGGGVLGAILGQPFLLLVAAVIIIAAAVLGVLLATQDDGDEGPDFTQLLLDADAVFPFEMADGRFLGDEDAPLTLKMFEDFQCPICLGFTAEDEPSIVEEYVKAGKLRLEYTDLPVLGTESTNAARAGICAAEQGKFWQFHNRLFQLQAEAGQHVNERTNVGRFSDGALRDIAGELELDTGAFDACYVAEDTLTVVQDSQREAQAFGLSGTPGFLLNGQPIGSGRPANIDEWRKILDDAYTQVTTSPTATTSPSPTGSETATPAATASPAASGTPGQ